MLTILIFAQAATASPAAMPPIGSKTTLAPTAKVDCRMVQEVGSRIPVRICRLDNEWDLLAEDAQNDMRSSRHKPAGPMSN